jgi:hypothetical protein
VHKREIFMVFKEEDTYQLVEKVVTNLKYLAYLSSGPLVLAKTKLLGKVMKYFLGQK